MVKHNVKIGDVIVSKKKSLIWIDIGEFFIVKGIVKSEGVNKEGVLFIDRTGSERVFWHTHEYSVIIEGGKSMVDKSVEFNNGEKVINEYCNRAYEIAKSKGWHEEKRETGTVLALIHSEVSEALEADRKGDSENFAEELADIVIRVFDLCGSRSIDLGNAIENKMLKNENREYKHGGKAY